MDDLPLALQPLVWLARCFDGRRCAHRDQTPEALDFTNRICITPNEKASARAIAHGLQ